VKLNGRSTVWLSRAKIPVRQLPFQVAPGLKTFSEVSQAGSLRAVFEPTSDTPAQYSAILYWYNYRDRKSFTVDYVTESPNISGDATALPPQTEIHTSAQHFAFGHKRSNLAGLGAPM
jgi:hypothetical protein